ncbi:MAG: Gfo/Idh/MocA family oxidoreductase [Lewinellaceae bacterium]|nr:Gfo/Idh/MocA family oxidoreductase [Lewinellaceae bacterium]
MQDNRDKKGIARRDILKGLAALPVLGVFFASAGFKSAHDKRIRNSILQELDVKAAAPPPSGPMSGPPINIGIIGFGGRGEHLTRALGYATPQWIELIKNDTLAPPHDTRLKDYFEQENLNVRIAGICDVFDVRTEMGVAAGARNGHQAKAYRDYRAMLDDPDIEAVVIATPDHWHAPIAIAALQAGKHVYLEKCMTHKLGETYELYETAKNAQAIFQVGHQHRQTQSFLTAQDIIRKNVLGHISLIQTNTNRNDDVGAWQYDIHPDANPRTVDWQGFLGNAPSIPFDAEQLFRWRKYWAYGTGLSGDLLTHDYDRINCLLNMGIPSVVTASGGIYTHRDNREVPDVFQVVMEYPDFFMGSSQAEGKEKGMAFLYSASLGNQYDRGTLLMGHDATMQLGQALAVYADPVSTRYLPMIEEGIIQPDVPIYAYDPSAEGIDAVTGATAKYFANKGLMYTYRDGKRVDSTYLHLREWLSVIRNGGKVSAGIEEGFEEAISAHMATIAYRTGKRVEWDPVARRIKGFEDGALEAIGMA